MAINFAGNPGKVWIVMVSAEGITEYPDVYSSKEVAVKAFSEIVEDLDGDPAEVDFDSYNMAIWHDHPDASESVYDVRMYEIKVMDKV